MHCTLHADAHLNASQAAMCAYAFVQQCSLSALAGHAEAVDGYSERPDCFVATAPPIGWLGCCIACLFTDAARLADEQSVSRC